MEETGCEIICGAQRPSRLRIDDDDDEPNPQSSSETIKIADHQRCIRLNISIWSVTREAHIARLPSPRP